MQQVRFGIVGVGNMGSAHLSHILRGNVPELKVTAVADINPARLKAAKAAAEKAGQPRLANTSFINSSGISEPSA